MPELGPLIEQGVTSVYSDDQNTETVTSAATDTAGDTGVSTVSLVTTRTPDTGNMSTTAPMVISANIDTIVTTTHLNSVDISVTTLYSSLSKLNYQNVVLYNVNMTVLNNIPV